LERPISTLERGRRELDGTVASNKAVKAGTIFHEARRESRDGDRQSISTT